MFFYPYFTSTIFYYPNPVGKCIANAAGQHR